MELKTMAEIASGGGNAAKPAAIISPAQRRKTIGLDLVVLVAAAGLWWVVYRSLPQASRWITYALSLPELIILR